MKVFVKTVESGTFAAVGVDLGMSATMVGEHIQYLEELLGSRLIQRTTRRQSLTEAGALYFVRCKQLLADLDEADASVQRLGQAPRGVLRVHCPVTFGVQRLAPALADYLAEFKDVRIELQLNDRTEDFLEANCDVAFRIGVLADSSLIARQLQPYRMVICAAPAYFAKHGAPRVPGDLAQHNCLEYMYWDHRNSWRFGGKPERQPVTVSGNLTVNQGQALRQAALAGLGVIMQPEALVAADLVSGHLVAVLTDYAPHARPMHIVYRADRHVTPKLQSFVAFILKRFGKNTEAS